MEGNFSNLMMPQGINEKERKRKKCIDLAMESIEKGERLSFPGIAPDVYERLKASEEEGYCTPIDDLIERFKKEGIKLCFGRDVEKGDIFVLPVGSDDLVNDSVFLGQLQIEGSEEKLQELISLSRD